MGVYRKGPGLRLLRIKEHTNFLSHKFVQNKPTMSKAINYVVWTFRVVVGSVGGGGGGDGEANEGELCKFFKTWYMQLGMRSQCGAVLFWCVVQYKMDYTSYLCLTTLLQQDTMMNSEAKVPLRCPLLDTVNRTSTFNCLIRFVSP